MSKTQAWNVKRNLKRATALALYGCYIVGDLFAMGRIRRKNNGKTRVLVFHHLDDSVRFERILRHLQMRYNILSYEEYRSGRVALDRVNLLIALDDGYQSWFSVGLPIFKKLEIYPILFISTGFLNLDWRQSEHFCIDQMRTWPEQSLTSDELSELAAHGCEIGTHGHKHLDADVVSVEAFKEDLEASIALLESLVGVRPRLFTFPFGHCQFIPTRELDEFSFEMIFDSAPGWLDAEASGKWAGRTNCGLRVTWLVFAYVEGIIEFQNRAFQLVKGFVLKKLWRFSN